MEHNAGPSMVVQCTQAQGMRTLSLSEQCEGGEGSRTRKERQIACSASRKAPPRPPLEWGEGAPGSRTHLRTMRGSPLCRAKRASMATRQRGPPPQGSTASHERYDMGGATPSPCRHRHAQNPAGQNPTKGTAEGVVVAHRSRLRGGRLLPVSGIFF